MSDKNQSMNVGKYASERFNPKVPVCGKSPISLLFDGKVLKMTAGVRSKRIYEYPADSGKPDKFGRFSYSKERQKKPFIGSIPAEDYWINPKEFWENAWYKITSSYSGWGDFRVTIHPYPKSQTYGRGGFFIHGGTERGSAGCIDLTNKISYFYRDIRKELNGNTNCYVELKAKYE